jgi:hypothetical protein
MKIFDIDNCKTYGSKEKKVRTVLRSKREKMRPKKTTRKEVSFVLLWPSEGPKNSRTEYMAVSTYLNAQVHERMREEKQTWDYCDPFVSK